ncbi:MAG: septal ring lytic transglycosylase RlpA family protein [Cyanobacteria bacterium P01_D01_bin.156]
MFDVPVLEVTVPLSSGLSEDFSHSKARSSPYIPSSLSNAVVTLSKPKQTTADVMDESIVPNDAEVQALTPQDEDAFQALKPLNLARVTAAFEQVLTLSVEAPSPVEPAPLVSSQSTKTILPTAPEVVSSISDKSNDTGPQSVILDLRQPSSPPVVLRQELQQCVVSDMPPAANHKAYASFQLMKQGVAVGNILNIKDAAGLAGSIEAMLAPGNLDPNNIQPVLDETEPAIQLGDDIRLEFINLADTHETSTPSDSASKWATITWTDQLRQAMGGTPLDPGNIYVLLKGLKASEKQLSGIASWYGPYFHGRLTANGEIFDQGTLTAAHKALPFNTMLQVRNLNNNRTVVVRINDRGPYIGKRSLDLSKAAAQCLGSQDVGIIPYEAVILEEQPPETVPADS